MSTETEKTIAGSPVAGAVFPVVALAASAGGLDALTKLLAGLPADFPAPVVIAQHLDPYHRSYLAKILSGHTVLAVKEAEQGDRLRPGVVYIAPPDRHLLVGADGSIALSKADRVRFVRPSADVLFRSLAASFRRRAIAVVLTGTGRDGADGVRAVKQAGGVVIAQDEATSAFFGMPHAAIESGQVDFVLPLAEIAARLIRLVAPAS